MAFTPESIAAAYQQAVAAGISPETFAQVAQRDYGVTPGQLVAAQATLVGADNPVVQNNLRALPQQEVVNYLRASSPTRINVTGAENQGEGGGMTYTAPGGLAGGGNMLRPTYRDVGGESGAQLTGFTRPLTPEFDPTFAGGQFGNYVGVYDPQGNLVDIRFQQQERHGGFIGENQQLLANLALGAMGAFNIPGLSGALGGGAFGNIGAGAITGGFMGGANALVSDENVLRGAAKGAVSGGIGAAGREFFGNFLGRNTGGIDQEIFPRVGTYNNPFGGGIDGEIFPRTRVDGGGIDDEIFPRVQRDGSLRDTGIDDEIFPRTERDTSLRDTGIDDEIFPRTERDLTLRDDVGAPTPVPPIDEEIFPRTPTDPNIDRPPIVTTPPGGDTGRPRVPTVPGVTGTDWAQIIGQLANVLGGANAANAAREAAQIQAGLGREALGLQREMFERQVGLQEPFRQGGLAAQNRLMDLLGLGLSPEQLAGLYRERVGQGGATEADFVNWARSQGVPDSRLMQARNMLLGGPGAAGTGMSDFGSAARPFSMDSFRADPGYGFRLSEGLKALERSQAARGGLMSGGTGKALQRFGQDMASQEYGNAFNRFYTEREALLNPLLSLSGRGQTSATQTGQAAQQFGQQGAQSLTGIGNAMAAGQVGQANAINQAIGQGVSMYNQGQNQNLLNQVLARSMG